MEWVQGDHVSFTRNQNYWQGSRPYLDGYAVSFTKIVPQALVVRLEAGALDFVNYPPTSDAIRLAKDAAYQVLPAFDVGLNYVIWMNVGPPFDKKEVRQAMNYAIDRQRFVDTTLGGLVGPPRDLPWRRAHQPASYPGMRRLRSTWTRLPHCSKPREWATSRQR